MTPEEQKHPFHTSRGRNLKNLLLTEYMELVAAVSFLSVLPMPGRTRLFSRDAAAPPLIGSAYFPLVGLLLGFLLYLLVLVFTPLIPQPALAGLLVVALALLTGGLHLDGLMDTCDGLFGGSTRERKLEIMRDSRVGSFGVLSGVCILLLKFAFLVSLREQALPSVLLVTLPSARWALVLVLRVFPGARPTGLGEAFRRSTTPERLILAGIMAAVIALATGRLIGLIVLAIVSIVAYALGFWISKKLGGLTGDTYGAIEELAEVIALFVFVLMHV